MSIRSRIMTGTLVDSAALVASSAADGKPVANLQNDLRTKVHRFTGCQSEHYQIDFGARQYVNTLCLANHNLGPYATITVQAGIAPGDASLHSVTFDAWRPVTGYGQKWGLNWGGYLSQTQTTEYFLGGTLLIHYLTANIRARYWQIVLIDPGNSAGYIECGRLFLDWYRQSMRGVSSGLLAKTIDPSGGDYSLGGQKWGDEQPPYRTRAYRYTAVPASETWAHWYALIQQLGVMRDFIIDGLYGITDSAARYQNQLYCHVPTGGVNDEEIDAQGRGTLTLTVRESL